MNFFNGRKIQNKTVFWMIEKSCRFYLTILLHFFSFIKKIWPICSIVICLWQNKMQIQMNFIGLLNNSSSKKKKISMRTRASFIFQFYFHCTYKCFSVTSFFYNTFSFLHFFSYKFHWIFYIQNFIVNRKWMFSGQIYTHICKCNYINRRHTAVAACSACFYLTFYFLFIFILCESMEKSPIEKWMKKENIETSPGTEWSHFKSTPSLCVAYVCMCCARETHQRGRNTHFHTMFMCVCVCVFLTFCLKCAIIQRIFHRFILFYFTLRVSVSFALIMLVFFLSESVKYENQEHSSWRSSSFRIKDYIIKQV